MLPEGRVVFLTLALGIWPVAAMAADKAFSCADKSTWTSPVQEAECMSGVAGSERLLQTEYEGALAAIRSRGQHTAEVAETLEAGQAAWQAYRAAQCQYALVSSGNNTAGGSAEIQCVADMNRERAIVLAEEAQRWRD